jgi:hypothetical protein
VVRSTLEPFRVVKEKLVVAFGRGFERGYDGLGYLQLTGQIDTSGRGKLQVDMEGDKTFNGKYDRDSFMDLVHKNSWRDFVRKQMESGLAFRKYMDTEGIDPQADIDPQDSGTAESKKLKAKEEKSKGKKSKK